MSLGSVIALATDRLVDPVEGMHRAITGRWLAAFGASTGPMRTIHDALAGTVYGSVRIAGAVAGLSLDHARAGGGSADAARAFVNGL
ncbi:MAG: hypothetical protein U9O63_08530, partial [Actinomycetota bacterium]|nr:hypothetical protein [Actinomycetota bacterium]